MKNLIMCIIGAIMLFFIIGCPVIKEGSGIERDYHLENGTNYKIELKFYRMGEQYFTNDNILSQKGATFTRTTEKIFPAADNPLNAFADPDSLIIIYNESRIAKIIKGKSIYYYSLIGIDKNLFDNSVYTIENDHNYRYVFTENDYKKAIDCGGSCE